MILSGDPLVLPNTPSVNRLLQRCLELHSKDPDTPAYICAEDETDTASYKDIHDQTICASHWFVANGYKKGEVIFVTCNNDWRVIPFVLGAWRAGLIVTVACPQFTDYEMRYQLTDSQAVMVLADELTFPLIQRIRADYNLKHVMKLNDALHRQIITFSSQNQSMPSLDLRNDVAFLPYSSGTTGKPKGVMITHLNVTMMLTASIKKFEDMMEQYGLPRDFSPPNDLHFLPLYHAMGFFRALINMCRGSTQIMFHKFDLELMMKLIEKYTVLSVAMVPAILVRFVNSPLLEKYDMSSLINVNLGSAPLPDGAVAKLKKILPDIRVAQGYGMTELTFASHMPTEGSPETSVGRVMPGTQMKVKKEDGELCRAGEVGECWIKGPQVMKGYWRKPELTAQLFDADGFMRTGDIVYFDENGDTFICDRVKELIKVNAEQVAPAELESVLLEHHQVADACVFGVDDVNTGEKPVACVVLGKSTKSLDEVELAREIMRFLNDKLVRFKHIKEVHFVKEIARTGTGKILRRNMKKAYLDARKSKM